MNAMLLEGHEGFHAEKEALLPTARAVSDVLHTDDTTARHRGQHAVCTHFGNELFASFHTTDSKSRLNFLRLLCQPEERYSLNDEMLWAWSAMTRRNSSSSVSFTGCAGCMPNARSRG